MIYNSYTDSYISKSFTTKNNINNIVFILLPCFQNNVFLVAFGSSFLISHLPLNLIRKRMKSKINE